MSMVGLLVNFNDLERSDHVRTEELHRNFIGHIE